MTGQGKPLSLKCRVYWNAPHEPCSGTADDGTQRPCGCRCHAGVPEPDCPGCRQPPVWVCGGGTQAFCGTPACHVVSWDPTRSLAENAAGLESVDLSFLSAADDGDGPVV